MKCQAPKSTPAATTLTSTSAGPNPGRSTSRKSSTSADPYLSCTIAFIRPHLTAIQPTAPATVVLGPGPRQSRRSAEEPGPVHRALSRRLSTPPLQMGPPPNVVGAVALGVACRTLQACDMEM